MALASSLKASSSSTRCSRSRNVNAALHFSKPSNVNFRRDTTNQKLTTSKSVDGSIISTRNGGYMDQPTKFMIDELVRSVVIDEMDSASTSATTTLQMYSILDAVADRVEMHRNIGEQRNNWNTLLLNSINMMTLTATTMVGLSGIGDGGAPLKLSSTVLFGSATCMLLIMNKIQPSQLAEEQRNATRLFQQLLHEIQSMLSQQTPPTKADLDDTMDRVLALDRAYPLPLLGKMLEKFPKKFEAAVWWPKTNKRHVSQQSKGSRDINNGWSKDLEEEMNAILDVLKTKDEEDYVRLGNVALKVNKLLSVSGPALTAIASVTSVLSGFSAVSALAGAMAVVVNSLEHGGQVGMVVEMYRNCAGFFKLLSESIESTLEETDWGMRENGELFERKVALKLGRSLSDLRGLARRSVYSSTEGQEVVDDEFGSKLF